MQWCCVTLVVSAAAYFLRYTPLLINQQWVHRAPGNLPQQNGLLKIAAKYTGSREGKITPPKPQAGKLLYPLKTKQNKTPYCTSQPLFKSQIKQWRKQNFLKGSLGCCSLVGFPFLQSSYLSLFLPDSLLFGICFPQLHFLTVPFKNFLTENNSFLSFSFHFENIAVISHFSLHLLRERELCLHYYLPILPLLVVICLPPIPMLCSLGAVQEETIHLQDMRGLFYYQVPL